MGLEQALAIWVDRQGIVTVAGSTTSDDFPVTPNAFTTMRPSPAGQYDATVSRLDMLPTGVDPVGLSSSG